MNNEQYKQVKAAVKWWLEQDPKNRIVDNAWSKDQCRCPLGALCEKENVSPQHEEAEGLLDTSEANIEAFVCGFDAHPRHCGDSWWHEAGSRLRRELIEEGVL